MCKEEVQQRVLQYGKPLDLDKFEWDEETSTFSTTEKDLILSFGDVEFCNFNTGDNCIFYTDDFCNFNTGSDCTFKTTYGCTFKVQDRCVFITGSGCTFDTGDYCTFITGDECTFDTGPGCTFDTGDYCVFKTGSSCAIVNRNSAVNKDAISEVIIPKEGDIIQIFPFDIKGHLVNGVHSVTGERSIIADNILSKVISKRNNIYKKNFKNLLTT